MTASDTITRRDPWQNTWRFIAGDVWLAAGGVALAALLAAAAALPQSPPGDPIAFARWLSDAQERFGGAFNVLSGLGLFDVVHSFLFRAALGAIGLALAARLIDRVQEYRAAAALPSPPDAPRRSHDSPLARNTLTQRLRGYRIRTIEEASTVADHYPWSHRGAIVAHAGLLIMLIGLAVSPLIDARTDAIRVFPGASAPLPNTPYTLLASSIDADGRLSLTLQQDGLPIASGEAARGRPWLRGDVSLFVRELWPALRVRASAADGQSLRLVTRAQGTPAPELLLTFDRERTDASFAAPDGQMAAGVSLVAAGDAPAYRISVVDNTNADLLADETIRPPAEIDVNGARFTFAPDAHAVVSAVRAPAQAIVVGGLVVASIGLAIVAVRPARRIWLVANESGTRLMSDDAEIDLVALGSEETPR
jgi:hypothetical protein